VVQVVRAGAAGGHDRAAHISVGREQQIDRGVDLRPLLGQVRDHHEMTLVTHDAAHLAVGAARRLGKAAGVFRRAAAARQPDVHVDQHVGDARSHRGIDRGFAVDRDRHAGADLRVRNGPETIRIEHLVRQQQVVAEPGRRHAEHLSRRGARERAVPEPRLCGRDRRALVGLDMWPQPRAGERGGHRDEVLLERLGVEHERRRGQLSEPHDSSSSWSSKARKPRGASVTG
jgi:hypothetical protein